MRLEVDQVFFGIEIPLDCFEPLALAHFKSVKDTAEVEALGRSLVAQGIPASEVADFVLRVCKWGGDPRIWGRVRKNSDDEIRLALSEALNHLTKAEPDVSLALAAVKTIKGLGLSFASKHLRFLCPELCPVFDSYLRAALPYRFDNTGYALFAADCRRLAQELTKRGAVNPWPGRDGQWFAADAEAAIYQFVRSHGEEED